MAKTTTARRAWRLLYAFERATRNNRPHREREAILTRAAAEVGAESITVRLWEAAQRAARIAHREYGGDSMLGNWRPFHPNTEDPTAYVAMVLPRPVDRRKFREAVYNAGYEYNGPGRRYQHGPFISRTPSAVTVAYQSGLDI